MVILLTFVIISFLQPATAAEKKEIDGRVFYSLKNVKRQPLEPSKLLNKQANNFVNQEDEKHLEMPKTEESSSKTHAMTEAQAKQLLSIFGVVE